MQKQGVFDPNRSGEQFLPGGMHHPQTYTPEEQELIDRACVAVKDGGWHLTSIENIPPKFWQKYEWIREDQKPGANEYLLGVGFFRDEQPYGGIYCSKESRMILEQPLGKYTTDDSNKTLQEVPEILREVVSLALQREGLGPTYLKLHFSRTDQG